MFAPASGTNIVPWVGTTATRQTFPLDEARNVSKVQLDIGPVDRAEEHPHHQGMLLIPGGTFRMGSNRHYPEEAPVHRVNVDSFLIDPTPVTNHQFKDFV